MIIDVTDLFCGAGGTTTGLVEAGQEQGLKVRVTAVNHWPMAIETHKKNHPDARHLCASVDNLNPTDYYQEDKLDILWASPECTHHSIARGGKPMNDQSRATAMCVIRWAEKLRPKVILVENVKEFLSWGPIGTNGQPIKGRKGDLFRAWVAMLEAAGYRVEWRILCAADYGDPTTRRRLFIFAVRGRRRIIWPEPTHAPRESIDMFSSRKPWVAAREIIDWADKGASIFSRKKPLAEKTLRRIEIGLQKFGLKAFIVPQQAGGKPVHSVEDPVSTITTTARGVGLARPFLVHLRGTGTADSAEDPVRTVAAGGTHIGLVEPFLVQTAHGNGKEKAADDRRARPLSEPLATVAGNRGEWALIEPFLVGIDHKSSDHVRSTGEPVSSVTSKQRHALVEPFLVRYNGSHKGRDDGDKRVHSAEEPLPAVDTSNRYAVADPYLIKFNGTASAMSVDEPLDSVTTRDRFGLCRPVLEINGERYVLDILFRMLRPKELAQAQGFPVGYQFAGNTSEVVKQIGNAVPKNLAKALGKAALAIL